MSFLASYSAAAAAAAAAVSESSAFSYSLSPTVSGASLLLLRLLSPSLCNSRGGRKEGRKERHKTFKKEEEKIVQCCRRECRLLLGGFNSLSFSPQLTGENEAGAR